MREVSVFYAYDDTEFFDREECLEYEKNALDHLKEINEKYSFFDKNMNLYCAPLGSSDIDDWVDWLVAAGDKCEFIHREANLTVPAENIINNGWGCCILNEDFNYKTGWFQYDFHRNEWVKIKWDE